jgi:magnesium transporter
MSNAARRSASWKRQPTDGQRPLVTTPRVGVRDGLRAPVTTCPLARCDDLAGNVRTAIAGKRFATASQVAVCEDSRLLGLVSIEDLLAAPADARMRDLMDADPPLVAPGLDQEKAAWKAVQQASRAWRWSMSRAATCA